MQEDWKIHKLFCKKIQEAEKAGETGRRMSKRAADMSIETIPEDVCLGEFGPAIRDIYEEQQCTLGKSLQETSPPKITQNIHLMVFKTTYMLPNAVDF